MNRAVRVIAVISLLMGVCSPAICSTLCALGMRHGDAADAPAVEAGSTNRCSNDRQVCCGWIAKKVAPPASPASMLLFSPSDAAVSVTAIELPKPCGGVGAPILPASDYALPGPPLSSDRNRAPPM